MTNWIAQVLLLVVLSLHGLAVCHGRCIESAGPCHAEAVAEAPESLAGHLHLSLPDPCGEPACGNLELARGAVGGAMEGVSLAALALPPEAFAMGDQRPVGERRALKPPDGIGALGVGCGLPLLF